MHLLRCQPRTGDPNESDDSYTSQQVSAGWAKVMTVTIPHFHHHHMKYISKTARSIEHVWKTMAAERCYICGHCFTTALWMSRSEPADWLADLSCIHTDAANKVSPALEVPRPKDRLTR